ncbi:protocatechuate 3,4-dioxygenase subunit alpha [Caldimonas thermodepolymerans]|jgi:protocatechuate 3,4-dioxygenase alpha subunit|uniref:Protocatechuate 3,4-dioxygenase alpha subunit n=1 Tax=Caldimonas thermodepolymerans TaxID=215580 RepID=A0A2S5T2B5_9BURK|nr:protocatechuate 3,4-dioxygenase subunit alpha [Caldimonas thermodepolymerans]PPE69082.1 protocatechuate 3,4-dioxygenase subunit alpha [Caldimonas thermodepolymerans]QPC32093.1 protocatechuate 3,4-dioxygenase subunit alpha [Caldimonas thermodepolymerans]RDH95891.1 protocatechuate 3,4-dioxygenase alpha subunit [Caldimonas thermodepolymerans]TCP08254.1 protocatechuate 3,4-dioxygenase alpha subunit [Caldimonas thermodepolymerans]UZG44889.1 protocatechuate 3,4-dioxygenase subunit alpha [Caldimon
MSASTLPAGQRLPQTPSQTVGPYFAYGLTPRQYHYDLESAYTPVLAQPHAEGEHIRLYGQVLDGEGRPIDDAMIEICHLDARGREVASEAQARETGFRGFGRCGTGTDPEHRFVFHTIKPAAGGPGEAPYIDVIVTMRGMLSHAFTRIYFDDEAAANAEDPVLQSVPAERRDTLIARRETGPAGVAYRFDIRMQGPQETVFFDL